MATQAEAVMVPINMYENAHELVITAPLPGLLPEDITISVEGRNVAIRGELRGEMQEAREYLVREWSTGPCLRVVEVPYAVDGRRCNATYGNGVLTLALPRAAEGAYDAELSHRFRLETVAPGRGEVIGHRGREARPAEPGEHEHGGAPPGQHHDRR